MFDGEEGSAGEYNSVLMALHYLVPMTPFSAHASVWQHVLQPPHTVDVCVCECVCDSAVLNSPELSGRGVS